MPNYRPETTVVCSESPLLHPKWRNCYILQLYWTLASFSPMIPFCNGGSLYSFLLILFTFLWRWRSQFSYLEEWWPCSILLAAGFCTINFFLFILNSYSLSFGFQYVNRVIWGRLLTNLEIVSEQGSSFHFPNNLSV